MPDEPREKMLVGSGCAGATSMAVCSAGATMRDCELYEYIAALKQGAVSLSYYSEPGSFASCSMKIIK